MSGPPPPLGAPDHSTTYIPPPPPPTGPGQKTVRRRNRVINSCLECRRRKLKCSREYPCAACQKHGRKCVFLDTALDSIGLHKLTEIKNRVGSLEDLLETEVAARSHRHSSEDSSTLDHRRSNTNSPPVRTRIKVEDLSGPANLAPSYENDTDEEIADLGVRIGRMKLSERMGGLFRASISKEMEQVASEEHPDDRSRSYTPASLPPGSFLAERILPSSSVFTSWISPDAPAANFIPHKTEADLLYFQYFACVDPLCHVVHKPTFDRLYQKFWTDIYRSVQPVKSVFALMYSVFFAAVVSLSHQVAQLQFGLSKDALVDKFRVAAEYALVRANFLKATKIETLQAFTIYLFPQCRAEISRSHYSLVGALIRLAESHSLHRDVPPHNPHASPLEIQTRRLLWHAILFLDLKTSEVHSPRPAIRSDDYDTKLPLNIDDMAYVNQPNPIPTTAWTSTTFSIIRYECYVLQRFIYTELNKPTLSYTALVDLIREKRARIENTYFCYLDGRIPIQKTCLVSTTLFLDRLTAMATIPYLHLPEPPIQHLVPSAIKVINSAIVLETAPELGPWAWYSGAFQQFASALLLLPDALHNSSPAIERCLDYVFGPCQEVEPIDRARALLRMVKEKMDGFQRIRRSAMEEDEEEERAQQQQQHHQQQQHQQAAQQHHNNHRAHHMGMATDHMGVVDPAWGMQSMAHATPADAAGIEWLGYSDYGVHGGPTGGAGGALPGPTQHHEATW